MRILVVDDDAFSRYLLRTILEGDGYQVAEATDGKEAWKLLAEGQRPDLCVLDLLMPEMDGVELLRQLRSDPRFSDLKVILCSSLKDRATITSVGELSITYYLLKPYTKALVLEQVRKAAPQTACPQAKEDAAVVCDRLGIDQATYLDMRQKLIADMHGGIASVRALLEKSDLKAARVRLGGWKGACDNLGVVSLATRLSKIESLLEAAGGSQGLTTAVAPGDSLPAAAGNDVRLGGVREVLAELETESGRLAESIPPTPSGTG